jgi:hypothetical protein
MNLCLNCNRNVTDKTICDSCRSTFPYPPEVLEEMIKLFESLSSGMRYPGAGSSAPSIKTCRRCGQKNRVPLGKFGRCGKCKEVLS